MKRFVVLMLVLIGFGMLTAAETVNGAGASFPAPLYMRWAYDYQKLNGTKINYQSVGSGAGIAQIKASTVDFGASDAPMTKDELDKEGLTQFPMIVGGVVPVVNLKGVTAGSMKLSGSVLAEIFMGKITAWNDPKIAAENSGITLPDTKIIVVHRADGSGTTWIFTNYLAAVSPEWKSSIGASKEVKWPAGVGGKGNEGVAANVRQMNGSIGYVEYAYAKTNKMNSVQLKNKEGVYVNPSLNTFQAAAANADWKNAPAFAMILVDQPGRDSWPITGASYIIIHKNQAAAAKINTMLTFFNWCFNNGAASASALDYVPLTKNITDLINTSWKNSVKVNNQQVWK
ncbi:MAG TPA: phosphate ABC transporter substrate-binding protein PstS [bacterium]|nr:phosphate ABC transporter substrate-binding protein PstS [bacterium]HPS29613.1 phosphate ABC transporter substrate-binding protein PstS [bacterium]